mgnify:CR=1 FL=1
MQCALRDHRHSERRQLYGETNESILSKLKIALGSGLRAILCIGETDAERKAGKQDEVIRTQLSSTLFQLDESLAHNCVIAYEPVWAIGTGNTATPEQVQPMHALIRKLIGEKFGIPATSRASFYLYNTTDEVDLLVNGIYKVKNEQLKALKGIITQHLRPHQATFTHVFREQNTDADALANKGVDERKKAPTSFSKILSDYALHL